MTMKHMLVFFCFSLISMLASAQIPARGYDSRWKTVDSLLNRKGLPQSALQEVNKIYDMARRENNTAEAIKALIYRLSIQENTKEDPGPQNIAAWDREIAAAAQPGKAILQSQLATYYWNYFQEHRWLLYNRTNTSPSVVKDDIATWGAEDFHRRITELYLQSIADEALLRRTSLTDWDPVILKGNVRKLRPTLFDLLAHRALDYFKTDERNISKPAYAFELDDPAVFAPAPTFAAHRFSSRDDQSLHVRALGLFQRLISFHLTDADPSALLDVDIERLRFAHQYAFMDNKDGLYTQALTAITDHFGDLPAAAEAWYQQAQLLYNKAIAWKAQGDTTGQYAAAQARAICDRVLTQKDSSQGQSQCRSLLHSILRQELSFQTESVNVPDQPFRSLVSWRNIPQVYFRIVKVDQTSTDDPDRVWDDAFWKKLLAMPTVRTFSQALPATGDYQMHHAEIRVDGLPVGKYALLASPGADFALTKNLLVMQYIDVSNIAYVSSGNDYFVVHRTSGQPLSGAKVQVWSNEYDQKAGKYRWNKGQSLQTDANGHCVLTRKSTQYSNPQQRLEITAGSDHIFPSSTSYRPYIYAEDNPADTATTTRTFFFTDRSIYRPGQTLYFKGIVIARDGATRQSRILPSFVTRVILYNVNGEKLDSVSLTTNEFGSYHGTFRIPENGLNGEFRIEDDSTNNNQTFSVEEYKRPKFYVEYPALKETFRLGDSVKIRGNAKAYSGNNIDGAKVSWRVTRQTRYPYPWLFGRSYMPHSEPQEIAHGETTTGADGSFVIPFTAIPDRTVSKASEPVFTYMIAADVTDINGETRSGSTTTELGYKAITLSINLPEDSRLPADSLKNILVSARTLNGESIPSDVTLTIRSLKAPDRLIRERYWQQPDQFVISESDYRSAFPLDEYKDELNKQNWERTGKVSERLDSTGSIPVYRGETSTGMRTGGKINDQRLLPGYYVIEARTKDKFGQEVKDMKYVELTDSRTGAGKMPHYRWEAIDGARVEPGGKATVRAGTSATDVFVIRKLEHTPETGRVVPLSRKAPVSGEPSFSFLRLSRESKTTEFPVTMEDRGGFALRDVFVKDNRIHTSDYMVTVPWTDKELNIRYKTFRDKTLPGSEERWQVQISGAKAEKVAAEVLAGMYDASLDQFKAQSWEKPDIYPVYVQSLGWYGQDNFAALTSQPRYLNEPSEIQFVKLYDALITVNRQTHLVVRGYRSMAPTPATIVQGDMNAVAVSARKAAPGAGKRVVVSDVSLEDIREENLDSNLSGQPGQPANPAGPQSGQIRTNFQETAFFFPDLRTDADGNISFSFTMPESLTRWKWMTLAHTKDLAFGYSDKTIVTQKELMVQPNAPRFLREGDRMELGAKIVNLTDKELTGQVALQLTDPTTGKTADGLFSNRQPNQYFTVPAHGSVPVNFAIDIPYQYNRPLTYRIVAQAQTYSDGEEAILPVVSNRMLVTESLPLNMSGNGTKQFRFDKLLKSGSSETLNNHALTVEFTSNPAWYAVQALPYLMEYPHECAEQVFNRFYANALASKIVSSSPRIQAIFARWKTADTAALLSNLQKNQELKAVLLEETPWVMQAKTESQQKKNIALLFDMVRMGQELQSTLNKLKDMQLSNGGFVWFSGGPDNRYITQYILTGIGHLQKLGAIPAASAATVKQIVSAAIPYLDQKIKQDYEELKKAGRIKPLTGAAATGKSAGASGKSTAARSAGKSGTAAGKASPGLGPIHWFGQLPIHYLYMRSFFPDNGIPGDVLPAVTYFRKSVQQDWVEQSKYIQGLIALSLFRSGDVQTARDITASLKQTAIRDEEKGMYWKGVEAGYYWYQAPVETQALLIEAFREISGDASVDRDCRTWLLRQKQTRSWSTTRATADACYALMLGGSDWLSEERQVSIRLGEKTFASDGSAASGAEAGTGYFKQVVDGPQVQPSMGNITVTLSGGSSTAGNTSTAAQSGTGNAAASAASNGSQSASRNAAAGLPAWGAIYWQYFDNLDRITPPGGAQSALHLSKQLFIERNTDRGPVLEPIGENATLHVGDKVKVRVELKADRDMEYVFMKDMRAACMEPVNVISQYKWQGGLGYYESTKDASTNFFFDWMPRGTYVFEYPLFVNQAGNFSNGVTSIECMYAPEFSSHSEGVRVNVEPSAK